MQWYLPPDRGDSAAAEPQHGVGPDSAPSAAVRNANGRHADVGNSNSAAGGGLVQWRCLPSSGLGPAFSSASAVGAPVPAESRLRTTDVVAGLQILTHMAGEATALSGGDDAAAGLPGSGGGPGDGGDGGGGGGAGLAQVAGAPAVTPAAAAGANAGPPSGAMSPMAVDVPVPDPEAMAAAAAVAAVTPGAASPSAPDSQRRLEKTGSGSKGKGKGGMGFDLPDLDSEPDLSEPEPDAEPEVEGEDIGGGEDEGSVPPPAVYSESHPITAPAKRPHPRADDPMSGGSGSGVVAAGAGGAGLSYGGDGGGAGGSTTVGVGSRNVSEAYGSGSDAGGRIIDESHGSSSDEDDSAAARPYRWRLATFPRRRKVGTGAKAPADQKAAGSGAGAATGGDAGAACAGGSGPNAAELDAPSRWDEDEDYIYKDADPNDLDLGIEFTKMEFKPEDLELPPEEDLEEGEEMMMGEDGKPVKRVRMSAAALAEAEAFIGLEGLVSWGRDGTFRGTITHFDPTRTKLMWLMLYEDGDEEWGAVTEDRSGWRVHGGLRPVSWLSQPPPPTDPLNLAAAAADAVPAPESAQRPPPAPAPTVLIPNMMNAEMEVSVGREGQTRYGTIVDFDPNRPRYKWYVRYVGYADPAYGGTGEWGSLDDEKTTWLTHGYKRPVVSVTGGDGGMLPVAPPKPPGGAATAAGGGVTPRKGPFGRTGLGLMYLMAASEPAPDGKFRLPVMALGAMRGAYGSPAGMAAAAGSKAAGAAALGFGLPPKPERVSSQALAGVPDEYGATLVGAKITITVGRGQGHKRSGTITEYDANRPKYRWRLTFDAVGEPAHGGAAEWGMLSEDQSLWLAHGYKRNITALSGVPERKPRPAMAAPTPTLLRIAASPSPVPPGLTPAPSAGPLLPPQAAAAAAAAAADDDDDDDDDAMDIDGGAGGTAGSPETGGGDDGPDGRQRSPTEGDGGELSPGAGGDSAEAKMDAALAAAAEAAVAIMYGGNMEVAAGLGIDVSELNLGGDGEELGMNLVGAKLLVAVGRGGARRSGVITDYEPNRPRYRWRLVYDAEVLPVGQTPAVLAAGGAAKSAADGGTAADTTTTAAGAADGAGGEGKSTAPAEGSGTAAAAPIPAESTDAAAPAGDAPGAKAAPATAVKVEAAPEAAGGPSAPAAAAGADTAAGAAATGGATNATASAVVEGEWGTLSDDRTAWLCHGYRRAILASEGIPTLPASYFTATAAAAAMATAQSPGRKRRPNILDEQSVASALLTLGKRARREAKAAAAAAREARQAEIAAAGGHVILIQQPSGATAVVAAGGEGAATAATGATGDAAAATGGADGPLLKRVKLESGGEASVPGVTYVRQPVAILGGYGGAAGGNGAGGPGEAAGGEAAGATAATAASDTGPVSPIANPEGVVGLEVDVDREPDGRQRGRVLSYDAKKPRLRWLVRYHDGNQEWGTFSDDLTTLRVYGAVRPILWTSRPPAVMPKNSKNRNRISGAVRASPAAAGAAFAAGSATPGTAPGGGAAAPAAAAAAGAGGGSAAQAATPGDGAGAGNGGANQPPQGRSSENGDGEWNNGSGGGCTSGGTDYRYIFRRNGMCRAQITHQGCAIISPYYDTPEAAAAAADYYNYKLRGTAAHLNLGLTPEQRAVLDHLTLEQLQAYVKGRGDIHDLSKALLQYAGPEGLQLHQQLQLLALQRQQQQLMLQHQQQLQLQGATLEQIQEALTIQQQHFAQQQIALQQQHQQLYAQRLAQQQQHQQQLLLLQQQQHQQQQQELGDVEGGDSRAASADPRDGLASEEREGLLEGAPTRADANADLGRDVPAGGVHEGGTAGAAAASAAAAPPPGAEEGHAMDVKGGEVGPSVAAAVGGLGGEGGHGHGQLYDSVPVGADMALVDAGREAEGWAGLASIAMDDRRY